MRIVIRLCFVLCTIVAVKGFNEAICNQPKEIGPCRASHPHFFYNPKINDCDFFLYGGCNGNDNRFANIEDCRRVCVMKLSENVDEYEDNVPDTNSNSETN